MSLAAGTKLGPYEIISPLGAGGMGEVYRARDTRLGRDVAIKVLPEEFAKDAERLRRFEGEARSASALSDPHIVTVYDVGEAGGVHFFASELVEGSDLRHVLDRGALPINKALDLAEQIASGLAAAHEKGIVHRDLKPENVLITKSGQAKIADFGLAKLAEVGGSGSQLPTSDGRQTTAGVVMGTVHYMSPEQARGGSVDFRSDQFAFGTVLYEMLAGKNPFARGSAAQTMAAIIDADPAPIAEVRPETPEALVWVVERCLAKNADERYGSTRDLARDLRQLALRGTGATRRASGIAGGRVAPARPPARVFVIAGAAALAGLGAGFLLRSRPTSSAPAVRLSIPVPARATFGAGLAVSPDGSSVAFVAAREDVPLLWLRPLSAAEARPLAGTEGAVNPFWSPDGRFIGFFADLKVRKVEIATGAVQTICNVVNVEPFGGGTWNRDGTILFAPDSHGPIFRVSASGGSPVPATALDPTKKEDCHVWPEFLPDGRHFLFMVFSGDGKSDGIAISDLGSRERNLILPHAWRATFSDGHLLFSRDRVLRSQAFDPARLTLSGESFSVAEDMQYDFAASARGTLVYRAGTAEGHQLRWFDRAGRELGKVGKADDGYEPEISPDGRRVAVGVGPWTPSGDVWLLDVERGTSSRFTFDPKDDATPVWSPDGKRIVFSSNRNGHFNLFVKDSAGIGPDELLWRSDTDGFPADWSSDGAAVLCSHMGAKSKWEVWVVPTAGDRKPWPFLSGEFNAYSAVFSPDRRWVAYSSDESGRPEVYVQSFPHPGEKFQISTRGGDKAVWRSDGNEILYLAPDRKIMSVAVRTGPPFSAGLPEALFEAHVRVEAMTESHSQFAVSPDGRKILVDTISDEANTPITVALNWTELAK